MLPQVALASRSILLITVMAPAAGAIAHHRSREHFLTRRELSHTVSVECLEAKREDPSFVCLPEHFTHSFTGKISAGNFPDYHDVACNSGNGEFFCDPDGVLNLTERTTFAKELKSLRDDNLVVCGALLNDQVDPRHLQPFYLGVAVLSGWPLSQADPESLQQLGQIVAAQWSMDKTYAGEPEGRLTCPNTGMLIVLPDLHQAYLSTSSCEFICQAHGGPEVVIATIQNWSDKQRLNGLLAGIRAAYSALAGRPQPAPHAEGQQEEAAGPAETETAGSSGAWVNLLQQVLYALVLTLFVVSLAVGVALVIIGPGLLSGSRKI